MQEHRYKGLPRVLIDECYGCCGLFLDPGELRLIRDALGERAEKRRKVDRLLLHDVLYGSERVAEEFRSIRTHALTTVCRTLTRKLPWLGF